MYHHQQKQVPSQVCCLPTGLSLSTCSWSFWWAKCLFKFWYADSWWPLWFQLRRSSQTCEIALVSYKLCLLDFISVWEKACTWVCRVTAMHKHNCFSKNRHRVLHYGKGLPSSMIRVWHDNHWHERVRHNNQISENICKFCINFENIINFDGNLLNADEEKTCPWIIHSQ